MKPEYTTRFGKTPSIVWKFFGLYPARRLGVVEMALMSAMFPLSVCPVGARRCSRAGIRVAGN
jgi:hypothetical protein